MPLTCNTDGIVILGVPSQKARPIQNIGAPSRRRGAHFTLRDLPQKRWNLSDTSAGETVLFLALPAGALPSRARYGINCFPIGYPHSPVEVFAQRLIFS